MYKFLTHTFSATDEIRSCVWPGWEECSVVESVERDVEHFVTFVEHVLDPIAVMYVPVKNHHSVQTVDLQGVLRSYGHVVEYTKRELGGACQVHEGFS